MPKSKLDAHTTPYQQLALDGLPETRGVTFKTQVATFTRFDDIARNDMPEELAVLLHGVLKLFEAGEYTVEQAQAELLKLMEQYKTRDAKHDDRIADVSAGEMTGVLKSILPKEHVKPNNKLANEITRDFIKDGEITLSVDSDGVKKEITTKAVLTYNDKNVSLSGRSPFTPYDREVHDAVVTLYVAGNSVITAEMVYRAMNGMTDTEKVSPQAVGAVTRSLDKSRSITVNIDFSQEAQAYKKNCKATYEGYLLACNKLTVKSGGSEKEAYKLLGKPILYEYAQVSGQILTVPIRLLQTKEAVRGTEDVIVLRGYLLRQIEGMKSKTGARDTKITYGGVYAELDITPENFSDFKGKTKKIKTHIDSILKEWAEKGYIRGHSQYKEGGAAKGVSIALHRLSTPNKCPLYPE